MQGDLLRLFIHPDPGQIRNHAEFLRVIHLPDHLQALKGISAVGIGPFPCMDAVDKVADLILGLFTLKHFILPDHFVLAAVQPGRIVGNILVVELDALLVIFQQLGICPKS